MNVLEEFTCFMYGKKNECDVNKVRADKLKEKCGIDKLDPNKDFHFASLPPCKMALEQHGRRVNYQVGIWRRAHLNAPIIPKPTEGHGWHIVDGNLEPLWVDGPILPPSLVDLLEPVLNKENDDDKEENEYFEEIWEEMEEYISNDDE